MTNGYKAFELVILVGDCWPDYDGEDSSGLLVSLGKTMSG